MNGLVGSGLRLRSIFRRPGRAAALLLLLLLAWLPVESSSGVDAGWIRIDYGELVDTRRLSHSGESVGDLLDRLREDPADRAALGLLDPLIEPYAFVLADVVDSRRGAAVDPPLVEVGLLWTPGEAQPAWAELLRSRRYLVESDGAGVMRAFLPAVDAPASDSAGAVERAVEAAWPVLRHVFAAERRRLAAGGKGAPDGPALDVEFHVYRHDPSGSVFHLGEEPLRRTVTDTRPSGRRPPLDLDAIREFLDRGLRLEGARIEPDGTLRLLGSPADKPPTLLGRPLALHDFAVAYRAVFHGGRAEPYMSLDRGFSPQTSIVNYGGRLRDTALGMVSLLCDIRFKTFSQGLGIEENRDLREMVRQTVPGFRTHLEQMAFHPEAGNSLGQQTRLWLSLIHI